LNCRLEENVTKAEYFEKQFHKKIVENKARKSSYQYNGLVAQDSYFIDSKLTYLKYTHNPENGKIEFLEYFDEVTDSLIRIIRRKTTYEREDWNSEKRNN
jgi:hypothetical protein